jgi:hypothetical protein
LLVFNFPDAESLLVRAVYRHRFWMFTPSVRTFMSSRGCAKALYRAGFEIVRLEADVQRPSLAKLFKHARADFVLPLFRALGLAGAVFPVAFPVPAVRFVAAKTPPTNSARP